MAGLLVAPAAHAAGPRPLFQMPVACGQTWEASTYDGHWPDQDSIDLGEWDAQDTNVSKGEPVLAAADGKVLDVFTHEGGDNRVYLDHGNGWVTHYIHLEQLPPLTKGQAVAQGEQIGRVGNSGTEEFHLHFTELEDGKAVRSAFNGSLINTGQTNPSSWNTWGNGEKLTSANCPMNSFVNVDQGGTRSLLYYKPGTGKVAIDALKADGRGVIPLWTGTWTKGWTHLTPFSLGGKPHYIAYKSSTGAVDFDRVNAGGFGVTTIGSGTWSKGWTYFMPFALGGKPYYVAYNSLYGGANVDRINAAGNGASTLWSGSWGKGWTHLAPFVLGGVQYFIAYQGGTGAVEIDKITGSGNSVSITEVWAPSVVFGAFSDPNELAKWWGPKGFNTPSLKLDPRVGESYRIEIQPPEGDPFFLTGKFREVDPPTRLAYTFVWEDLDPDDVETQVGLSFRGLGESTEVAFIRGPFKTEERRALHRDGWTDGFDKLERLVSTQSAWSSSAGC